MNRLATGWRIRAQARDDAGELHQLRVVPDAEDEARALLLRRAEGLSSTAFTGLDASNTIAEAGAAWLEQLRARAIAGSLSFSTHESYETALWRLIVPQCGGITLGARSPSGGATGQLVVSLLVRVLLVGHGRAPLTVAIVGSAGAGEQVVFASPCAAANGMDCVSPAAGTCNEKLHGVLLGPSFSDVSDLASLCRLMTYRVITD
ncbi:MAG TPA: hypothetical protein VGC45_11025 [Gryllotalpicola sp.]